jgi:hypothetical protein
MIPVIKLGAILAHKRQLPMSRRRWNSCVRKDRHDTRESADEHLQKLMRYGDVRQHVYGPCYYCGGFHVGNSEPTKT